MKQTVGRWSVISGMILVAALSRLLPHPPNFTPVGAMALFGGAVFASPWAGAAVPLAAMALSDVLLGLFVYKYGLWHNGMPFVYVSLLLIVGLGRLIRSRTRPVNIAAAAVTGSVLFFLITNFGVWLNGCVSSNPVYPPTAAGLVACYVAALPFFGYTLGGDLLYASLLFGGWALLLRQFPALGGWQASPVVAR
jgi:hypothetical protein